MSHRNSKQRRHQRLVSSREAFWEAVSSKHGLHIRF